MISAPTRTVSKKSKKKAAKKAAKTAKKKAKAKKKASKKAASNGNGTKPKGAAKRLTIEPPNFQTAEFQIRGTTEFCQHKFSAKAFQQMRDAQAAGKTNRSKRNREPKDFDAAYRGAMHRGVDGSYGIPAVAFFKALVSACRLCDFKMTLARQALYVFPDVASADPNDRSGLVRLTKGEPVPYECLVRIQQTTDIRARPLWEPGWEATVRVRFDADILTLKDVANLLMRAGLQVGVGEGRPDTPSGGMGWGLFELQGFETPG